MRLITSAGQSSGQNIMEIIDNRGVMYTRLSKIGLVWAVAFFCSLVAFNNLTDYNSNYQFINHVLKMDTTFANNNGMWRAINSPLVYHIAYNLIIFIEVIIAGLCWLGGFRLLKRIKNPAHFNKGKGLAIIGLTLGIALWFSGFITIGGEWFLMWQSKVWNGQQAAFRLVVIIGIVLLFLTAMDKETDA
jgi:predicted small integral membrane protein